MIALTLWSARPIEGSRWCMASSTDREVLDVFSRHYSFRRGVRRNVRFVGPGNVVSLAQLERLRSRLGLLTPSSPWSDECLRWTPPRAATFRSWVLPHPDCPDCPREQPPS